MPSLLVLLVVTVLVIALSQSDASAHQSGCHRWHSCPSDTGGYTCGDTGYCSECPDNNYCKAGEPIASGSSGYSSSSLGYSSSNSKSGTSSSSGTTSTKTVEFDGAKFVPSHLNYTDHLIIKNDSSDPLKIHMDTLNFIDKDLYFPSQEDFTIFKDLPKNIYIPYKISDPKYSKIKIIAPDGATLIVDILDYDAYKQVITNKEIQDARSARDSPQKSPPIEKVHTISDVALEKWMRKIDSLLVNGEITPLESVNTFAYLAQKGIVTQDQNLRISEKVGFIKHVADQLVKGLPTKNNSNSTATYKTDLQGLFAIKVIKCEESGSGLYLHVGGQITNLDSVSHSPELVYKGIDKQGKIVTFEIRYAGEILSGDTIFVDSMITNDPAIESCGIAVNHPD